MGAKKKKSSDLPSLDNKKLKEITGNIDKIKKKLLSREKKIPHFLDDLDEIPVSKKKKIKEPPKSKKLAPPKLEDLAPPSDIEEMPELSPEEMPLPTEHEKEDKKVKKPSKPHVAPIPEEKELEEEIAALESSEFFKEQELDVPEPESIPEPPEEFQPVDINGETTIVGIIKSLPPSRGFSVKKVTDRLKKEAKDLDKQIKKAKKENEKNKATLKKIEHAQKDIHEMRSFLEIHAPLMRKELEIIAQKWDEESENAREIAQFLKDSKDTLKEDLAKLSSLKAAISSTHKKLLGLKEKIGNQEDSIKKEKEKLIKKQRTLTVKENKISDKEAKFDEKNSILRERERKVMQDMKDIEERKRRLEEAKDIEARIPAIKREFTTVSNRVQAMQDKIDAIDAREKELELREKELRNREEDIARKARDLLDREERLLSLKEQFIGEVKKQIPVVSNETVEKIQRPETARSAIDTLQSIRDVYDMIYEAKQLLSQKDVGAAKEVYYDIDPIFAELDEGDEKKRVYLDILELKNDIDLAALG